MKNRKFLVGTRNGLARILSAGLLLGLTACVGNPYIANTRPEMVAASNPMASKTAGRNTIEYGLQYADITFDAYEAKLKDEFTRQQALSGGLLTLGALAVGLAAGHAHIDALRMTALGGALTYQLGTWNSNQGRLGLYVEGMKALTCAARAVAPLRVTPEQLEAMRRESDATMEAAANASVAAGYVAQWISLAAAIQTNAMTRGAQRELNSFASDMRETTRQLGRAAAIPQRAAGAGDLLVGKVDEIRYTINRAIKDGVADVSNLPKLISGISDYANVFVPGINVGGALATAVQAANVTPSGAGTIPVTKPAFMQKPAQPSRQTGGNSVTVDPAVELAQALGQLRAARNILAARTAMLSGASAPEVAPADLSGCIDAKASVGMALSRNTIEFTAGSADHVLVGVSGGTLPYSVSLLDAPANGITISAIVGGSAFDISASANTEQGRSYRVGVRDSAASYQVLTVNILDKP